MATLYITPDGSGLRDGSTIDNAGSLADLPSFVGAAGPDGEVLLVADQGAYTSTTLAIVSGGTTGHPVTIRGIDSEGQPAKAVIVGQRPNPYVPNAGSTEEVVRLLDGADNIRLSDIHFKNIGYAAIRVGSDIENLEIENVEASNVQRFLENYATGDSPTATIAGLTVRNVQIDGFSKGAIRLQYDTHDVLIEDVRGDSQRQDGENFAIGVHLSGTVHDVVVERTAMRNAYDSVSGAYWNGDGFATEENVYNVRFQDTVSTGNTDGGYDLKSDDTILIRPVAEGNKRNFRLWSDDDILIKNAVSLDPVLYGNKANSHHFGFTPGARATIEDAVLSDEKKAATAFDVAEGSATVTVTGAAIALAAGATLVKAGRGSTVTIAGTESALAISGDATFDGTTVQHDLFVRGDQGDQTLIGGGRNDVLLGGSGKDGLVGGAGNDVLVGGEGDDVLSGGDGADVLLGGAGFDLAEYGAAPGGVEVDLVAGAPAGGAAGDLLDGIEGLVGSAFADALRGDAGQNLLAGGGGDDQLDGRGGDDRLEGGRGADTLKGGDGSDTASYADSDAGVTVDLGSGTGSGGDAEGDRLSGIERIVGSAFADTLIGGGGDDVLVGGRGADTLDGGAGFDTADYATSGGAVSIDLGTGDNRGGDAEGDVLSGLERVVGSGFADQLKGDSLGNLLDGGAGDDTLGGGAGDDVLVGGTGADALDGGAGFDTADYASNASAVTIDLLAGTGRGGSADGDTLADIERVVGSAFADTLKGGDRDDVLLGGAGDDLLVGGRGADTLVGGDGLDTVSYAGGSAISLDLAAGVGTGDAAGDILAEIEIVVGSAFADLLASGIVGLLLDGAAGDDQLTGGIGDDVLIGGAGADMIRGGDGFDTADYSGSGAGVSVALSGGPGAGGDAEGDLVTGVERLIGSRFADRLSGDDGDTVLVGGAGADALDGGGGFDTADYSGSTGAVTIDLVSGTGIGGDAEGDTVFGIERVVGTVLADVLTGSGGDEILVGGGGADRLDGGGGRDGVDYSGSAAAVRVNLATGIGSGGDAEGDLLFGVEDLTGTAGNDTFLGDAGVNRFFGGAGKDTLDGGAGDDLLVGGDGDDFYTVDSVGDVVVEAAGSGTDRVSTSLSAYTLGAHLEQLAYLGTGSFTGIGNALNNGFLGSAGSEVSYGLDGDDRLQGSLGADTFHGGAGSNYADYSNAKASIVVNLTTNENIGDVADGDILYDVALLAGSNWADSLTGDAGANTIWGRNGADSLYGLGGDDLLDGGAGGDRMEGGAGDDSYMVESLDDRVIEDADGGEDTIRTTQTVFSLVQNVENLAYKGTRAFTGIGNALDNGITGGAGQDILDGGAGDDVLSGLGGADRLVGGEGQDTASYETSTVGVHADLAAGLGSAGDAQGDTFSGIENLIGSARTDRLKGNAADNRLEGGGGDDVLFGGDGSDLLIGGAGNDHLSGGDGSDSAAFDGRLLDYSFSLADETIVIFDLRAGSPDGTDHASGIELFQFADKLIGRDALVARLLANAPHDLALIGSTVAENAEAGTIVGTVKAFDDLGDTLIYRLSEDAGDRFTIDPSTGLLTVSAGAVLDHEAERNVVLRVTATDAIGLSATRSFTIDLQDVNEAPTALTLVGSTIAQNAVAGTRVGTITGRDPDIGDTLHYALLDDAGGRFTIDGQSGALTVAAGARIEAGHGYALDVSVRDGAGATFTETFAISAVPVPPDPYRGDKPDVISNSFVLDTRPGHSDGRTTITDFGTKDLLVVTKQIKDSNNDGIIQFERGFLTLSAKSEVKLTPVSGSKIVSLEFDGKVSEDGMDYFVYSRVGSTAGIDDLLLV